MHCKIIKSKFFRIDITNIDQWCTIETVLVGLWLGILTFLRSFWKFKSRSFQVYLKNCRKYNKPAKYQNQWTWLITNISWSIVASVRNASIAGANSSSSSKRSLGNVVRVLRISQGNRDIMKISYRSFENSLRSRTNSIKRLKCEKMIRS